MTERLQLDLLPTDDVVRAILDAEARVAPALRAQAGTIARAADLVASRMRDGGRLLFAGAGTSGRLAVAQAAELPGTFGLDRRSIAARVAGGSGSTDEDEDDLAGAERDIVDLAFDAGDVVVAVAASGRTPYTLALAEAARTAGAAVVSVTNTAGSPLAEIADVAIEAAVGPEVVRDSTRLTAGTAQKVVLDALTTAAMVRLGRVHGDLMVDVVPANAKLRQRAAGIVADIAGCPTDVALDALVACGDSARVAVVHLVLGLDPAAAAARAADFPSLRDALAP